MKTMHMKYIDAYIKPSCMFPKGAGIYACSVELGVEGYLLTTGKRWFCPGRIRYLQRKRIKEGFSFIRNDSTRIIQSRIT